MTQQAIQLTGEEFDFELKLLHRLTSIQISFYQSMNPISRKQLIGLMKYSRYSFEKALETIATHSNNLRVLYQSLNLNVFFSDRCIEIPVFIFQNHEEKKFFGSVFNRFFNTHRYLLHRQLVTSDPFEGIDEHGQRLLRSSTILMLEDLCRAESKKLNTYVTLKVDFIQYYYENGIRLNTPSKHYSEWTTKSQSQANIDAFVSYFNIDKKEFRYPSSKLYGVYQN